MLRRQAGSLRSALVAGDIWQALGCAWLWRGCHLFGRSCTGQNLDLAYWQLAGRVCDECKSCWALAAGQQETACSLCRDWPERLAWNRRALVRDCSPSHVPEPLDHSDLSPERTDTPQTPAELY